MSGYETVHQGSGSAALWEENVMAVKQDASYVCWCRIHSQNYQEASKLEQFVTRFLLKETLNQLQSLHNSLECAMETTEEQTRQEK